MHALRERGTCTGVQIRERAVAHGSALFCTPGTSDGRFPIAGVLANRRMTAEFVFLDPQRTSDAVLWEILDTVKHFSFELAT